MLPLALLMAMAADKPAAPSAEDIQTSQALAFTAFGAYKSCVSDKIGEIDDNSSPADVIAKAAITACNEQRERARNSLALSVALKRNQVGDSLAPTMDAARRGFDIADEKVVGELTLAVLKQRVERRK